MLVERETVRNLNKEPSEPWSQTHDCLTIRILVVAVKAKVMGEGRVIVKAIICHPNPAMQEVYSRYKVWENIDNDNVFQTTKPVLDIFFEVFS